MLGIGMCKKIGPGRQPGERGAHVGGRREAVVGVLGERAGDDALELLGHVLAARR